MVQMRNRKECCEERILLHRNGNVNEGANQVRDEKYNKRVNYRKGENPDSMPTL